MSHPLTTPNPVRDLVRNVGIDLIMYELRALLAYLEPSQRNYVGQPGQRLPYRFHKLAKALELPDPENTTVRDVVKLLCDEESFAILEPRASNDYWLLRLLISSQSAAYYSYGLPIWKRDALMGTLLERRALRAPVPQSACPAVPQPQPTFLECVASGAYLLAADGTLVPNALLIDEADRHFEVKNGAWGGYSFEGGADRNTPPSGPYMTKGEAEAHAGAWESYADTIGGCAMAVDVQTWTPPAPPATPAPAPAATTAQ
jgi:hypothetical protein